MFSNERISRYKRGPGRGLINDIMLVILPLLYQCSTQLLGQIRFKSISIYSEAHFENFSHLYTGIHISYLYALALQIPCLKDLFS